MLNIIIDKMRKVKYIEEKTYYLDNPILFEEYELLHEEIDELLFINTMTIVDMYGHCKFSAEALRMQLMNIIEAEPVDSGKTYELLSQYEYIERFVLKDFDKESQALFNRVYYFMDAESRADWLHANCFIENDELIYTNRWADFVIIAS